MKTLTRPVTLRGFGDDASNPFANIPTTPAGAVDWSSVSFPALPAMPTTFPAGTVPFWKTSDPTTLYVLGALGLAALVILATPPASPAPSRARSR